MKKIETVWCQLLYDGWERRKFKFQQQELAEKLGISLSTANHALRDLRRMGAVKVGGRGGEIVDLEKILMYWANQRKLEGDVVFRMKVAEPVIEIEGLLPPESILGAYSAVRQWYGEAPADYNSVYVYHREPDVVQQRLAGIEGRVTEVIGLQLAEKIPTREETTSLGHTFVDLWSLTDWMAKDFIRRIRQEMDEVLS